MLNYEEYKRRMREIKTQDEKMKAVKKDLKLKKFQLQKDRLLSKEQEMLH